MKCFFEFTLHYLLFINDTNYVFLNHLAFDSPSDQDNQVVSIIEPWPNINTCPTSDGSSNNESESWADFSNLPNDFNTSSIPPNACVTDSSAIPSSTETNLFANDKLINKVLQLIKMMLTYHFLF